MQKLSVVPVPSLRMQRQLQTRYDNMQYWWRLAKKAGRGSQEERAWRNRVDLFFNDIEGTIYLMGYNPLDHTRGSSDDAMR